MQVNFIIAIAVLSIAIIPLATAAVAVNTTTVAAAAAAVGLSSRRPGDVERLNASNLRQDIIFPSTKWCGQDNIAADYNDLGFSRKTDMCCRKHDHCPYYILGGQTKDNFTNTGNYTLSDCGCDEQFFDCLKKAGGLVAKTVGLLFFNVVRSHCVKREYGKYCKTKPEGGSCEVGEGYAAIEYDYLDGQWGKDSVQEIKDALGGKPKPLPLDRQQRLEGSISQGNKM